MSLATFLDKLRYSEFYFHHTGFGSCVLITHADKRNPVFRGAWAVSGSPTRKFTNIHAGRNAFYIRFLAGDDATQDDEFIDERALTGDAGEDDQEERFVVLAFDHHQLMRRNRIDLFISLGSNPSHIRARLTASRKLTGEQSEILFEDEVALFDDSREDPFVMVTLGA